MSSLTARAEIEKDVAAVGRIAAVPSILALLCKTTGLRFAAVARVTEGTWTACAVHDELDFGLKVGGELDIATTLCRDVREGREPIAIDHASQDPVYCQHPTPTMYGFESYISVPIVLPGGSYFGTLCALDREPASVNNPKTLAIFEHFAHLIAVDLQNEGRAEAIMRELLGERADGALREQFIAVLGHDLRTPLASILSCSHIMTLKPQDPALMVDLAERIRNNVRRMRHLVDNLLDFARGRLPGGLPVSVAEIEDLQAAFEEVLDELKAAHPNCELVTRMELGAPVLGDRVRLQQLLSNLVGNALTHGSAEAPVMVTAAINVGELEICVHNEGEPIPEETIPSLFDAYQRQQPTRPGGGVGLGLFICQRIVDAHRGELTVTSTQAKGTTFRARLPIAGR